MKKQILALTAFIFLFGACRELPPTGLIISDFQSADSTYISSQSEGPQTKKVVIEELTGVACTNCPAGTTLLNDFVTQNPNRIILAALHAGFLTDPRPGAVYDFRNQDSYDLMKFFDGTEPPKPSATFDRVPITISGTATYFINKGTGSDWIAALNARLLKTTPVNIHLTSSYNVTTNKVTVKATIHFTENVTEHLALTLYVLESGKKDVQLNAGVDVPDYIFNHIFQKMITPLSGQPILDSLTTKVKDRVLEKTVSFEPNIQGINGWNLDSCVVVGIVHKTGASKEVLQAEEVDLK